MPTKYSDITKADCLKWQGNQSVNPITKIPIKIYKRHAVTLTMQKIQIRLLQSQRMQPRLQSQ